MNVKDLRQGVSLKDFVLAVCGENNLQWSGGSDSGTISAVRRSIVSRMKRGSQLAEDKPSRKRLPGAKLHYIEKDNIEISCSLFHMIDTIIMFNDSHSMIL